jgi:hypothetical protein
MMRSEGETEARLIEPKMQSAVFFNVLASHVAEFLADKAFVETLQTAFERRGLTGDLWFATFTNTATKIEPGATASPQMADGE